MSTKPEADPLRATPRTRRPKTPPLSDLLRTREATAYARRSRTNLYVMAGDGRLTRYKLGAATYWSRTELDNLVRRAGGDAA